MRIISDRNSRRSKGIAYIEFVESSSVPLAIGLTGQRLLGVPIIVQASQVSVVSFCGLEYRTSRLVLLTLTRHINSQLPCCELHTKNFEGEKEEKKPHFYRFKKKKKKKQTRKWKIT